MLGHYPQGTMQAFLQLTHLTEKNCETNQSSGFIKILLQDHQAIIMPLRQNIREYAEKWKDVGSSDFLNTLIGMHEKIAWMLRAHL